MDGSHPPSKPDSYKRILLLISCWALSNASSTPALEDGLLVLGGNVGEGVVGSIRGVGGTVGGRVGRCVGSAVVSQDTFSSKSQRESSSLKRVPSWHAMPSPD